MRGLVATAVVLGLPIVAAAQEEGVEEEDVPLRPRYETPSELQETRGRQRFATLAGRTTGTASATGTATATGTAAASATGTATATGTAAASGTATATGTATASGTATGTATATVTAIESGGEELESRLSVPGFYSYHRGYWRDFTGAQLLASRSPPAPGATGRPASPGRRAAIFARGFYSYLSGVPRDWSGVEVLGQIDITAQVSGAGVFHHELRDQRAEFGLIALSNQIVDDLNVLTSFGVGNGAPFLPIVQFDSELRGRLPHWRFIHYGAGGGASWWSDLRRQFYASASAVFWLPADEITVEQRLQLYLNAADGMDTTNDLRATTTMLTGRHGKNLAQLRLSIGSAPEYTSSGTFAAPRRLTVDGSFSIRSWIAPHYGFMVGIELAAQKDTYARFGPDFALFVEM